MEHYFDHEKLEVYRAAVDFVAWCEPLLDSCKGKAASAKHHLDEASSSIPNNIAEGNGKWSKKDRRKFFEIARGSALECASCLDIMVAKGRVSNGQQREGEVAQCSQHVEPHDHQPLRRLKQSDERLRSSN